MNLDKQFADERSRRVKSLSNSRALYIGSPKSLKDAGGQALIVLCYAHWEGFFNFCVHVFIDFINGLDKAIIDLNPALLACEIEPHLNSMKDRNFRVEARTDFARNVYALVSCKKISQNVSILKAASNLDFDRLRNCLSALGVPEQPFLEHRNFIAHELVKWRHQVAHGDEPALEMADLVAHSHRTEKLLLIVKESFEDKINSMA